MRRLAVSVIAVLCLTIYAAWPQSFPGQVTAFYLHKNGVSQTGMTNIAYTQITWSTAKFNLGGGTFASNRYTASLAGLYQFNVQALWNAHAASTMSPTFDVKIIKNSAGLCNGTDVFAPLGSPLGGAPGLGVAHAGGVDLAAAGDVYEVCAFGTSDDAMNDLGLDGNQAHVYWSGHIIR